MTVYTVQSMDDLPMELLDHCVIGTYTIRGRALDECADYIMERIGRREDLAWSMAHDENHPEAAKFFREKPLKDRPHLVKMVVKRGCAKRLREFLRDNLGGQGCYYVWDGESSWRFDIDENDVEGELWHTVTWGDSDVEDPEFTTPWPESFIDKDEAIKSFVNYAKDLMAAHEMKVPDDLYAIMETQLDEDGKAHVDLSDGCSVSCVLYHDDAKNIK